MDFYENYEINGSNFQRVVWLNINGFGWPKIKDFQRYCLGSEKAIERLSQASSMSNCHLICACVNNFPIGYCSIVFIDEEFGRCVTFAIDYVYINEFYRSRGYSRAMAEEAVRLIDDYAKIKRVSELVDMSHTVSLEGSYFSSIRINGLRDLGYRVNNG